MSIEAKDESINQSIQKTEVDESVTPVEETQPQVVTFPEGGFWGWSTAIGSYVVNVDHNESSLIANTLKIPRSVYLLWVGQTSP